MDNKDQEFKMNERWDIVPEGPTQEEVEKVNKPGRPLRRPGFLGKALDVATGIALLGSVAALKAKAQEYTVNQTTPQVEPSNNQEIQNTPPSAPGVKVEFPTADAPVLGAPVEPVLSHKLFLPKIEQKYSDVLTPTEAFFRSTKVVDAVSTFYNGRTYVAETRITPAATYKVTIKEELKEQVARLVAKDGEKYQFTSAKIIIANSKDEIPEGVTMGSSFIRLGGEPPNVVGTLLLNLGGQRMGDQVILYIVPNYSLPLNDPVIQEKIHDDMADDFARLIFSGGSVAFVNIAGQTEHINLINQHPFQLSPL